MHRVLLLLVVALVVGSGCRMTLVRSSDVPTSSPPGGRATSLGNGVELPGEEQTPPPDGAGERSTPVPEERETAFVLQLVDENGRHPAEIPVDISGDVSKRLLSDSSGRVRLPGPPGRYAFNVPADCTSSVIVLKGASGRFGIADGQTTSGRAHIDWEHRYGPHTPVFSSVGPYWPLGRHVTVRYEVVDRCGEGFRAPHARLATFRFEVERLRFLEEPSMQADSEGRVNLQVTCTELGRPRLVLVDDANPTDRFDLIANDVSFGQRPECGTYEDR